MGLWGLGRKARLAGATTPPATAAEEPVAPAAPGLEAAGVAPAVPGTPHHWFSGQVERIAGLVTALKEAEAEAEAEPPAGQGAASVLPGVVCDPPQGGHRRLQRPTPPLQLTMRSQLLVFFAATGCVPFA